jgi:hypothetical protein
MNPDRTTTIPLPVDLIGPALRAGDGRLLRTWAVLSRVVATGNRWRLSRDEAVKGLRALGVGKSAAHQWVHDLVAGPYARLARHKGSGTAFVVLASIACLHAAYGVIDSGRRVSVPVEPLIRGRAYRQELGLAASAIHGGRPASRAVRNETCGVSPSTQIRGEKRFAARVEPNVVIFELHSHVDRAKLPAIDGGRVFYRYLRGKPIAVVERRANSVHVPFLVSQGSRRRHSSAFQASEETTSPKPSRQNFDSVDAARERIRRHGVLPRAGYRTLNPEDSRLFVRDGSARIDGRLVAVWRCVA